MGSGKIQSFRQQFSMEERCQESQEIIINYPDRVQVVVERYSKTDLPEMEKRKFLVPRDMSVGHFIYILSGRLHLSPGKALFVFVKDTLPQTSSLMESLYDLYKDDDGFLYMCYSSEKTFGCVLNPGPCLIPIFIFILILLLIFNHTFFNKIIFSITSITFPSFSTTHFLSYHYFKIHFSQIMPIKHTPSMMPNYLDYCTVLVLVSCGDMGHCFRFCKFTSNQKCLYQTCENIVHLYRSCFCKVTCN